MQLSITNLSDADLISQLKTLIRSERGIKEQVIRHLAEVETRRLYAKEGYSSLYEYARKGLGYSAASAMRRIGAARAGARAPEVFALIESGELSLSTMEVLSGVIKEHSDPSALVERFRGKSREEAEEIAAFMKPVPAASVRDRIKVVAVGSRSDEKQQGLCFDGKVNSEQKRKYFRTEVDSQPEKRFAISFNADEEFMSLLERAKELVFRGERTDIALENVLGKALRDFVSKRDPKERERRRQDRKARMGVIRKGQNNKPVAVEPESKAEVVAEVPKASTRRIPTATRDAVLSRDNHQCVFTSESGVRCGSRRNLEIDHVVPFALGGETSFENLRVLCAAHNRAEARDVFGNGVVDAGILRRERRKGVDAAVGVG